jgi:hypothetical protein
MSTGLTPETVLVRRLDVTSRRTDSVVEISELAGEGLLLETMIGRYVLNNDARLAWRLIDGRRTIAEMVPIVAETIGLPQSELEASITAVCQQFCELGVAELASNSGR